MFESEAKREAIDVNFFFFLMQIRLILQKCLALLWKWESLEPRVHLSMLLKTKI